MRHVIPPMTLFAVLAVLLAAQAERFEVASVRAGGTPGTPPLVSVLPGGRISAPNSTLRELVRSAYGVGDDRIFGGPDWSGSARFAVEAKAEQSDATTSQLQAMLAALLADRFRLRAHREQRELPVFFLTLARSDGRLGPAIRPAAAACAPITPPPGVPPPPPPPPGGSLRRPLVPVNTGLRCPTMFFPGWTAGRALTMAHLAPRLGSYAGRPVIDRTNLAGEFDFDLAYTPEQPPVLNGAVLPPTSDGESLFTAVREQLGLALEAGRAPLDVIVIDAAERPSQN